MPVFHAIAAMSENRVIGAAGRIPWHLKDDFRWFKYKTMGGTLLMGRKTFESIGKPLPGRKTIVLTRGRIENPDVEVCSDAASLPGISGLGWVCGGAEIYRQLLPKCERLYLTRVKSEVSGDTFFPLFEQFFRLDQLIHEEVEFSVERWINPGLVPQATTPEPWPFPAS
jgi:dihydrofolate reductase